MVAPKLRFKEFDGDWLDKKLGNIASKVGSGSTPRGGAEAYTDSGVIFIRSQNVNNNELLLEDVAYIPDATHVKMSGSKVVSNDILLNITGASIGRSCVVPQDFNEANVNQHVCIIRTPNDNPTFVQAFLSSDNGQNIIQSKQAGGGREGLNFQAIRSINFHFPPSKKEQTKIATFLSAVDEKIAQLSQKLHLLGQYKQGMMQKLFSQKIRFKADDGSEFGEWEKIKADHLFENYSNKQHDGTLTILAATQDRGIVPRNEIEIDIKSSDASILSYKIIEKGSFVISLRSFQGGIEYSNYYGICSPAYTVLKPKKPIAPQFYKNYLKTNDFIQRLSATVIGIRDGKQISYQAFATLEIDYPSVAEQIKIANFLSSIDQKIDVVAEQLEQAKIWKKGLLQQMFV